MRAFVCLSLVYYSLGLSGAPGGDLCATLHAELNTSSYMVDAIGSDCGHLLIPHTESVSGGFCLASLTAAGWYRSGAVNPSLEFIIGISGDLGNPPIFTASNSGGTMFIVRYFTFRDLSIAHKWTYPCYLLRTGYRTVCYFHGNFGRVSEECYSETQNLANTASNLIYGNLIASNGGPLGVVSSYCSVYFGFLSNLPIPKEQENFRIFWTTHAHWNKVLQIPSGWVVAMTLVSPHAGTGGQQTFNYGFTSYMSRGLNAFLGNQWYSNSSVYTVASMSANTLSGANLFPFGFAGKPWDATEDISGLGTAFKLFGLLISYTMVQKLVSQHSILTTRLAPHCDEESAGCPILDGAFTDNGPVTPVLSQSSHLEAKDRPREVSLLGAAANMDSIEYLLGQGSLSVWTGSGINLCPFTQTSICNMMRQIRLLMLPDLDFDFRRSYLSIATAYSVFRPDQQVMTPYCSDPLVYDHFRVECESDSLCHMWAVVLAGESTRILSALTEHIFTLSLLWLGVTQLATRFVHDHIPAQMRALKYYSNMDAWFPNFVATAPQKGGVGFTKIAGHALLDYLTYLALRLLAKLVESRTGSFQIWLGNLPPCGIAIYETATRYNDFESKARDGDPRTS